MLLPPRRCPGALRGVALLCVALVGLGGGVEGAGASASISAEAGLMSGGGPEGRDGAMAAVRLLGRECSGCHGTEKQRGGLSLASRESMLAGGERGAAVIPGQAGESRLVQVLAADSDPHMPPKGQLTAEEIGLIQGWIEAGADWDSTIARDSVGAPREVTMEPLPAGYQPVSSLALSSDGGRLLAGRGNRLLIYDVAGTNRALQRAVTAHADVVRAVAWSPDGRRVASGGFREVSVWDAGSLDRVWRVDEGLVGRVTAMEFSPHGGALILAEGRPAEESRVHLLSAEDGRSLGNWVAHADSIYDLAVSPDGGVLASGGGDKLVKMWELITRREIGRFEGHVGAVFGLAFGPHAAELVTVGADHQLKLWDVKTREAVVTMGKRRHVLNAVAWAAEGSKVVAVDDEGGLHALTEFTRHTGAQSSATAKERSLGKWAGSLNAVVVSGDGGSIFIGGEDGVVRRVSGDGKEVVELEFDTGPAVDVVSGEDSEDSKAGDIRSPSFVYDVLPRLAKAGCSAGSCHAKAEGQNGFHLSVFSYDPQADFAEVTREGRGRRVFAAAPGESLLLLKPTGAMEHGGGRRLDPESADYRVILDWIRGGMPYQRPGEPALAGIRVIPAEGTYRRGDTRTLRVEATYSDGSTRDVTALAEYSSSDKEIVEVDEQGGLRMGSLSGEGVVVARFMGWVEASRITVPAERRLPGEQYASLPVYNFIDRLAYARFEELGLFPSDLCTDAEFLRRASLDTIGVLPTPAETREFLVAAGSGDSRRARSAVIERLLARPEFGDYWANQWADLLRPNPDRVGVKSVFLLDQWLRTVFRENRPYDEFVRSVLLAEGTNHRDGPVVVYRDRREPAELATLVSQVFLGVRMECAKCHHHPNEKWSQDDFYQFASYFGGVKQKGAGLSPPISAGTETFYAGGNGRVRHPVTGKEMEPRPLGGGDADAMGTSSPDPRQGLADWMTSPDNAFFARAAVNRVWAAFFGRGFVEPVDDFRVSNPAVQEALLGALAKDFAAHGYDLKHLMRTILHSRLYQLSSTPNESNLADTRNFSRSYRRRLPAEVLLDAVNDVTGLGDEFNGCPPGTRAVQAWSYKVNSPFLDAFGRPNSSSDCPCERDVRSSVVQALHLMNAPRLQEKLASAQGRVKELADSHRPPAGVVEELYLASLNRYPSSDELATAVAAFTAEGATRQTAAEDVLWALLNSAEFVFNH